MLFGGQTDKFLNDVYIASKGMWLITPDCPARAAYGLQMIFWIDEIN